MKKFIIFNRLMGVVLASLVSANAFAFHCSTDYCKGFVTDFVAYTDSEVSIKLDGIMTIGGVTCDYLTLSQQEATLGGYKTISETLFAAYTTGLKPRVGVKVGTCNILYVELQ